MKKKKKWTKRKKIIITVISILLIGVIYFYSHTKSSNARAVNKHLVEAIKKGDRAKIKHYINLSPNLDAPGGWSEEYDYGGVEGTDTVYADTPLETASYVNDYETVKLLISKGADVNKVGDDRLGGGVLWNILANEKRPGSVKILALLLENGLKAEPDILHRVHTKEFFKLFEKYGADPEYMKFVDGIGKLNVLMTACGGDNLELVKYLVEVKGMDVNYTTSERFTVLMNAAEAGSIDVVKYLLEKGADKSIVSKSGETAFDLAKKFEEVEIIKLLE